MDSGDYNQSYGIAYMLDQCFLFMLGMPIYMFYAGDAVVVVLYRISRPKRHMLSCIKVSLILRETKKLDLDQKIWRELNNFCGLSRISKSKNIGRSNLTVRYGIVVRIYNYMCVRNIGRF